MISIRRNYENINVNELYIYCKNMSELLFINKVASLLLYNFILKNINYSDSDVMVKSSLLKGLDDREDGDDNVQKEDTEEFNMYSINPYIILESSVTDIYLKNTLLDFLYNYYYEFKNTDNEIFIDSTDPEATQLNTSFDDLKKLGIEIAISCNGLLVDYEKMLDKQNK